MTTPTQTVLGAMKPRVTNVGATNTNASRNSDQKKRDSQQRSRVQARNKQQANRKKTPKPKPTKQSKTDKYLAGDTTYQQQLADYNKQKADYNSNYTRQTGIVNRDYAASTRALNRQGAQDRLDQQNDFAGRGILHSGVFAKALGDYNTDFNARMGALTNGKTDQLGDLGAQRKSFLQQLQIEMNNARQDALRRRAAQLGI